MSPDENKNTWRGILDCTEGLISMLSAANGK